MKDTFKQRKIERTNHYYKYVFGWKLRTCTACNGSGYYDSYESPYCSSCDGTGRERYKDNENMEVGLKVRVEDKDGNVIAWWSDEFQE